MFCCTTLRDVIFADWYFVNVISTSGILQRGGAGAERSKGGAKAGDGWARPVEQRRRPTPEFRMQGDVQGQRHRNSEEGEEKFRLQRKEKAMPDRALRASGFPAAGKWPHASTFPH
jgi:hypothetical protein